MKLELANFQAVAANLPIRGEVCDLAPPGLAAHGEAEPAIAPLIQKVGATSIAEIDRLTAELQEAKDYLQSERKRIEQEAVRYTNLTQMASASAKIILDAISQWHSPPGERKSSIPEIAVASIQEGASHQAV